MTHWEIVPDKQLFVSFRVYDFGRPVKLGKAQLEHAENLINEGRELGEVATLLGVHRSTLYRRLTS